MILTEKLSLQSTELCAQEISERNLCFSVLYLFTFYPTEQDSDQSQDMTVIIQVEISNHLH